MQEPETLANSLAARPEKDAGFPTTLTATSSTPVPTQKPRSCAVCRSRKVRCDKVIPCTNCRRANITCVSSPSGRPPRWVRRLEQMTNPSSASDNVSSSTQQADLAVDKVMGRLRNLESLVKELQGEVELAQATTANARSPETSSQHRDSEPLAPAADTSHVHKQFGRLVLQEDAGYSHYLSTGFWARVDDELEGLELETRGLGQDDADSSDDEANPEDAAPTIQHPEQRPSHREAFLFGHNSTHSSLDLENLHPPPSQIPYLVDVFLDNVNFLMGIVHIPTITKMVRELRGGSKIRLTPSNEALMYSIYYAAVASMEEDAITSNLSSSKSHLLQKYRLGLENALAKADFLSKPNIVLVQALSIFLCLARRHDNPQFVWMMTGVVIRMSLYLGLQKDGSHFHHLSPFDVEMRRRIWWFLCMLDLRSSEDQGTDITIASGSFDTNIPLNINDSDIAPDREQPPTELTGLTDMSFSRIAAGITDVMRQMMDLSAKNATAAPEEQSGLLNEIYQKFEDEYFQYATEPGNIAHWVCFTCARLIMAKMTLIVFLPVLFSSPSAEISEEIRTKLLISAIEVAEYHHELNAEQACRKWRWLYQTCTHWHSIVYLLIETSRSAWSPLIERAWVALHSTWLIPAPTWKGKGSSVWIPLRRLMDKARKNRESELQRLRGDPEAAARLEMKDQNRPTPSSAGPFPPKSSVANFRERWRQLVQMPSGDKRRTSNSLGRDIPHSRMHATSRITPTMHDSDFRLPSEQYPPVPRPPQAGQTQQTQIPQVQANVFNYQAPTATSIPSTEASSTQNAPSYNSAYSYSTYPHPNTLNSASSNPQNRTSIPADPLQDSIEWSDIGPDFGPWLWVNPAPSTAAMDVGAIDVNMEFDLGMELNRNGELLDEDINWYDWVESAKGLEGDGGIGG